MAGFAGGVTVNEPDAPTTCVPDGQVIATVGKLRFTLTAAEPRPFCPLASASDVLDGITSNWGSQGQRPGPGGQRARSPSAPPAQGNPHLSKGRNQRFPGALPRARRAAALYMLLAEVFGAGTDTPRVGQLHGSILLL